MVSFTGTANSNISGTQAVNFYGLEINKDPGSSLVLLRGIYVGQRVKFVSGFLNLGPHTLDLDSTGVLDNESEISRVTTTGAGEVYALKTLNAPSAANPGNLGAIITSSQNLGMVIIRRGHQTQTNSSGQGTSIQRYYNISPANNSALNATLRFQYFDGELNSIDEALLVLFKSENGGPWISQGFSTRSKFENYLEKTGINSFSKWTLSSAANALPVKFNLFNIKCDGGKAIINWKTAQEQNTNRFEVQKSTDGIQWITISTLAAAGNSIIERSYSYSDNAVANNYYRIAVFDNDGTVTYTSVLRSPCSSKEIFKIWPNPSQRFVFVNIVAQESSTAVIRLFDNRGALLKEQRTSILPGSNQFSFDIGAFPNGIYTVHAEWNNGQNKTTTNILKQ